MNWSPLQREALEAMGLSPYRLATAAPADTTKISGASAPVARDRSAKAGANVDAMTTMLLRAAGLDDDAREAVLGICPAHRLCAATPTPSARYGRACERCAGVGTDRRR